MTAIKISKREFIKTASLGICALGCGTYKQIISEPTNSLPSPYLQTNNSSSGEWMVEAKYYVQTPKGLKCLLCPNECKMLVGEEGDCRTRVNIDNTLMCIAYGNPCSIHIDPIEKKPFYHFMPGSKAYSIATAGCNLACLNCQNWEISQTSPKKTKNFDLPPEKVVSECIKNDCKSIAYTYSDPVAFYEYALDTAIIAKSKGIKNVLVSAGYINEKPLKEWCKYFDGATIDLKSFSNELYQMLNAGKLDPVLNALKIFKEEGIWLEISNLVIPTWSDDLDMIRAMCKWLFDNGFSKTPLHFLRFQPMYKLSNLPATPVSTLEKAREIAISQGIEYVYIGNVPGKDKQNTYCFKCKNLAVERKGFQILKSNISYGKCNVCGSPIAGFWHN